MKYTHLCLLVWIFFITIQIRPDGQTVSPYRKACQEIYISKDLERPTSQHQNVNLNNVYKLYTFLIMTQIRPDGQTVSPYRKACQHAYRYIS